MTKEKYLEMCERFGDEVDESKMPPDFSDLPSYAQIGIEMYNYLGNRFSGGMESVYIGKEYSCLGQLFDIYHVEDRYEKRLILDVIKQVETIEVEKAFKKASSKTKK